MTLTAKQAAFVAEYLIDLSATKAAIRAGYSAKTANRIGPELLTKPAVAEAVAQAQAERAERTKIDADYVLRQAVKLHERCMQEIEPFTDRKGEQVYDKDGNPLYVFNASGAAKALELVGKHVGVQAFREQVGLGGPDGGPIRTETRTWREVLREEEKE
jgi:phage terminase small subunit